MGTRTELEVMVKNGTKMALEEAAASSGMNVGQVLDLVGDLFAEGQMFVVDGRVMIPNPCSFCEEDAVFGDDLIGDLTLDRPPWLAHL